MPAPVRHREVSRLEGFSDAVFGFALTLLVVSLDTPNDMAALRDMAGSFLPFALTFAMVSWIWYQHNLFFRRLPNQTAFAGIVYGLMGPLHGWNGYMGGRAQAQLAAAEAALNAPPVDPPDA